MRDVNRDGVWSEVPTLLSREMLFLVGVLNSFVADWFLRQRITSHLNMFYVYQASPCRVSPKRSSPRAHRFARRQAHVHHPRVRRPGRIRRPRLPPRAASPTLRDAPLRAEVDGLVAHLYGLTESEFAHVLRTFPVVPEPVREAARNAWRAVERGDVQ